MVWFQTLLLHGQNVARKELKEQFNAVYVSIVCSTWNFVLYKWFPRILRLYAFCTHIWLKLVTLRNRQNRDSRRRWSLNCVGRCFPINFLPIFSLDSVEGTVGAGGRKCSYCCSEFEVGDLASHMVLLIVPLFLIGWNISVPNSTPFINCSLKFLQKNHKLCKCIQSPNK